MPTLETKLRIDDWAGSAVEKFDDGRKITRAQARLRDGTDGLGTFVLCGDRVYDCTTAAVRMTVVPDSGTGA